MARAEIVGLVIYDSVLFNRESHVGRWAHSINRNFTFNAIRQAPVNKRSRKSFLDSRYPPGSLKASISGSADRIGPKHWQIALDIGVPYAGYVLGGTTGPITPQSANYMTLPRNPGFGTRRRAYVVSGQNENNFLARAAIPTARQHPSVRGLPGMLFRQW